MGATPLGFLAIVAGWTVTETGRQPFVVYGHLRTADAVTVQPAGAVLSSLILFFVVYNTLLLAFFWYGARVAMRGPDPLSDEPPNAVRPGLEQAGPSPGRRHAPFARNLAPGEVVDLPLLFALVAAARSPSTSSPTGSTSASASCSSSLRGTAIANVMMQSVAPFWDGNETWLVLGGAGLWAAFPMAYYVLLPPSICRSWRCCSR